MYLVRLVAEEEKYREVDIAVELFLFRIKCLCWGYFAVLLWFFVIEY